VVDGGVVTGWVVTGCVVTGVVAGSVVAGPVVAGGVVAGGWVAGEDGDCTGEDGGGTTVGVADWETTPPFCEGWEDGELGVPLVWAGGCVCETGEPQMTLGTTMAAAMSAASSPVASNPHARPRRFLRGGWPSPPGGWARKAASVGVRRGTAPVFVGGPLVLPGGGA
jgi:hypothetical protein